MLHSRKLLWTVMVVCAGIAFFAFAYPMYVIRPFRPQGAGELAAALVVRRWGPWLAPVAAMAALMAGVLLWRASRRIWPRLMVVLATAVTAFFAALSHVNIFEMMFHPVDSPQSVAAKDAKLEADDMVLAIHAGGHARAYPIRMMGYHHIVNDWVGGVPVVGTY